MSWMFVVFEGIDGSGKTTVSNRVAAELRERGIEVDHVREGGRYNSELISRMREFGKDPRNMAMQPLSELLFYLARDAQLLAECIEPALAGGRLVFADRYFYSAEVLSHFGRGLDLDIVRPLVDTVVGDVLPDLVVLLDVDPQVARARRRVRKIRERSEGARAKLGSRKGLAGVGMQHRLRSGYLELAQADARRWLVIDNCKSDLDEVVGQVTEAVARVFEGGAKRKVLATTRVDKRAPSCPDVPTVEAARRAFFDEVALRARSEPTVAAYFLAGVVDERARSLREMLLDEAPHVVAFGLRGLGDPHSWKLREELVERAPRHVALSLEGEAVEGARAWTLRERLFESQPETVIQSVQRLECERSWALRDAAFQSHPAAVVASLMQVGSQRAWDLRERYAREAQAGAKEATRAKALLTGLRGLGDERAWRLRDEWISQWPVPVLRSLARLEDERSWNLRCAYVARAPKIVMRTFDGQRDERAWALRRSYAPMVKESLDSMLGMDDREAWGIRDTLVDVWPSTVVKSLGDLAQSERGSALIAKALAGHSSNISLLKHCTQVAATAATAALAKKKSG